MKKIATTFLLLTISFLSANEIGLNLLNEKELKTKLNYNKINDTIDVFNIKESELGSVNVGSIGDASGLDISLGYGIDSYNSIYYNFEYLSINYGDTELKNKKHEIFGKINLNPYIENLLLPLSVDLGFTHNSSDDISLKNDSFLNSMIQKIRPGTTMVFKDGGVSYKGSTLYIVNRGGIVPFMKIANMSDLSFFIRAVGNLEFQNSTLNLYAGVKTTSIESDVVLHDIIQDILNVEVEGTDLKRDEESIFFGFNYVYNYQDFLFEGGYEYLNIFGREDNVKLTDDNHIFKGSISRKLNDKITVFIGGKAMLHQFNGVIPYLYNRYTKNRYTKKYGYAKIGFIYSFDTSVLRVY